MEETPESRFDGATDKSACGMGGHSDSTRQVEEAKSRIGINMPDHDDPSAETRRLA